MNEIEALDRLDAIQEQLSRNSPVRGYRAATVGWTAGLAVLGALCQPLFVRGPAEHTAAYLGLWVILALVGIGSLLAEMGRRFTLSRSRLERHGILRSAFTLLPAFGTAGVLTVALGGRGFEVVALLPALWMLCFALGVFASLPRLPHGVGWIGCYYFAAGALVLGLAPGHALHPWTMGLVFALGQAASAWVLARNPEAAEFPHRTSGGAR